MAGKPVIKGTRVTVERILEMLALGYTLGEVAQELGISVEDVRAAIDFARKWIAHEEVLEPVEVLG